MINTNTYIVDERAQGVKKWEEYDEIICPDGEKIDMNKLLSDQATATAIISGQIPFFGAYISKLHPIYTFAISTQATDGYHLFINPQFTSHLTLKQKIFVMAHELMHCLLMHTKRYSEGTDHKKANIAADYECNITLAKLDKLEVGNAPNMGLVDIGTMKEIGAFVSKKYIGWGYEAILKDVSGAGSGDSMSNKQNTQQSQNNKSQDYLDGWDQAMRDWRSGKLIIPGLPSPKSSVRGPENNTNNSSSPTGSDHVGDKNPDDLNAQLVTLKKQRFNARQNIRYGEKKGKNVEKYKAELVELNKKIADLKNQIKTLG